MNDKFPLFRQKPRLLETALDLYFLSTVLALCMSSVLNSDNMSRWYPLRLLLVSWYSKELNTGIKAFGHFAFRSM